MKKYLLLPILLVASMLFGQATTTTLENQLTTGRSLALSGPAISVPAALGYTAIVGIDEVPAWSTCGSCGNSNATGPTAKYSQAVQGTLSRDGAGSVFSISSVGKPYGDGYWYIQRNGDYSAATQFSYEFDLYVPAQYALAPQGIEFEIQQVIAGKVYNFAWQAEWKSKLWRVFRFTAKPGQGGWEATQIPVNLAPGMWHHIKADFLRLPSGQTEHVDLVVDGVVSPVNILHNAVQKYGPSSNSLSNAFQLDSNSKGDAFTVYVDGMTLTYK